MPVLARLQQGARRQPACLPAVAPHPPTAFQLGQPADCLPASQHSSHQQTPNPHASLPVCAVAPPPFPPPGENVCMAAACLWVGGIPAYLEESDVLRECSRHARVAGAVLPPPVAGQQASAAYVNFPSVRYVWSLFPMPCMLWRPAVAAAAGAMCYPPSLSSPLALHVCQCVLHLFLQPAAANACSTRACYRRSECWRSQPPSPSNPAIAGFL
jgi:hypothetical protein